MVMWEQFDHNEVWLLVMNGIAYFILYLIRNRFSHSTLILSLLWGLSIGTIFDFTLGGGLMDFYRVNDLDRYEGGDVLYYLLFAPFGYFYLYFSEVLKVRGKGVILYILSWALIGLFMQWLFTLTDILTLQRGYKLTYSFPVFLVTQSLTALFIQSLKSKKRKNN
ncbi:hypothetical protein GJU40_15035 [Bacillus lacus]|uniref:Uncharacterized protein n=1 Tax=Metabacillus lacus TaxID=1983721 RepID=A0A7X2J101_9BACI|nr:hypothetical protein [Metabacillus lacus]MRX73457.1 hypothetical protein [Metabacillus lacus]